MNLLKFTNKLEHLGNSTPVGEVKLFQHFFRLTEPELGLGLGSSSTNWNSSSIEFEYDLTKFESNHNHFNRIYRKNYFSINIICKIRYKSLH